MPHRNVGHLFLYSHPGLRPPLDHEGNEEGLPRHTYFHFERTLIFPSSRGVPEGRGEKYFHPLLTTSCFSCMTLSLSKCHPSISRGMKRAHPGLWPPIVYDGNKNSSVFQSLHTFFNGIEDKIRFRNIRIFAN